jgi:hypothetical protein
MKILRRHRTWLHTHFVTDCIRLPTHRMDEIQRQMGPVLLKMGIVFGLHFEAERGEVGVTIVLECKPLPDVLEFLHLELQRIVEPIPARPVALLEPGQPLETASAAPVAARTEPGGEAGAH